MELKEEISGLINAYLEEESLYLVDIVFTPAKPKQKLQVLVDGKEGGISIDQCASISRQLGAYFEENEEAIDGAFVMEVSSPGLDQPFKVEEQYIKNLGREVRIIMDGGEEAQGILKNYTSSTVTLEYTKNKEQITKEIPTAEILKTKLVIKF